MPPKVEAFSNRFLALYVLTLIFKCSKFGSLIYKSFIDVNMISNEVRIMYMHTQILSLYLDSSLSLVTLATTDCTMVAHTKLYIHARQQTLFTQTQKHMHTN